MQRSIGSRIRFSGFALLAISSCAKSAAVNCLNAQAKTEKIQMQDLPNQKAGQGQEPGQKKGSRTISGGTSLTVAVLDGCTNPGRITASIPRRYNGVTPAGVRSYVWRVPKTLTEAELRSWANEDSCVSMITESSSDAGAPSELDPANTDTAKQQDTNFPTTSHTDPQATLQAHLKALHAQEAYGYFYDPSHGIQEDVIIAIIDSGVNLDHEDLSVNRWRNSGEIPGNGIDDDHNGYIDDVYGYNFASRIPSPAPQISDVNSGWQWAHGTRVAGLAAAVSGNGLGGMGVMGTAHIMALNAMGKSDGFDQADLANAIRYAADNGANVINLSLGGSPASADYRDALKYAVGKGVVIVAAAGNEHSRIGSDYSAAGLASSILGLISIGNYKASDYTRSETTNYSNVYVELGAPGTNTTAEGLYTTSPVTNSSYSYFSGTSASAPVAAGAAALAIGLLKSHGYQATPARIERLLLDSATKVSVLTPYFKDGNALNLLSLAKLIEVRYPAELAPVGNEDAEFESPQESAQSPNATDLSSTAQCPAND